MSTEKVLHHVPSVASMCPLLINFMKREVTTLGVRSTDGLLIIAIRKQESNWVDKTTFSYVERYPSPGNPEGRKPDFEVIVIRDSIPKNIQEFVMWYEAHRLMTNPEDSFFGPHAAALWYAIQKCPSEIKTFRQYARLEEMYQEQEEVT